ncbi:MAG: ABC transporter permease [Bacteroidota bacterium]
MSTVFDLEKALAAWRRPLEHSRALSAEDLEELEHSLRDRVEDLVDEGQPPEAAFREAVRRMGSYPQADTEYRKVYWGKRRRRGEVLPALSWYASMLINYLKVALRNLKRQKGHSFINIAGLTLGLACCLLIFQYVSFEQSFDRFNEQADDLFRLYSVEVQGEAEPVTETTTGWAVGPAVAEATPDVVRFVRLHPDYGRTIVSNPAQPGQVFEEEGGVYYADPALFEMFSYPLLQGQPGQVLAEPGTVILSASAARTYFGDQDPLDQVLDITGWISGTFRVAGIFADVPAHSHLQFDVLLPMDDLLQRSAFSDPETGWGWMNFITYVQLRSGADLETVEHTFTEVLQRHRGDSFQAREVVAHQRVQPLRDVHLNEELAAPTTVTGSYRAVRFFTLIGLVTLLIALVNYVNLATARALRRAREVGVRKVVGAQRRQLITQFMLESALINLAALGLAVGLALALRPVVNELAGTNLTWAMWASPGFWTLLLTLFVIATLLAGCYPALALSAFRPVKVLKGAATGRGQGRLRQALVVLQFAASIGLLIGTAVVYRQLDFMQGKELGIDLEQVLTVPAPRVLPEETSRTDAVQTFAEALRRLPAVRQVATSSALPGRGFSFWTDNIRQMSADPSAEVPGGIVWVDTSFVSLYGLDLLAGGPLGRLSLVSEDGPELIVINETALRAVEFDTPDEAVGQPLYVSGERRIAAVVRDFDWSSAHGARENMTFFLSEGQPQLSVKLSTRDLPATIAAVEAAYEGFFPGNPFRYSFADERFAQQYQRDERFARLFGLFAALAMVIACLGLFGLASFTAQQRTKEIGVRKVLGASVLGLVAMLSGQFLRLVGCAFLVAAPLAYVVLQRWLVDFAYRIDLGPLIFLVAGGLVLVIALLTVSYQALRAALTDPVQSLRYE